MGRENSLPFLTGSLAPVHSGTALIRKGQVTEGVASLATGLAVWEEGGGRSDSPHLRSVLAEGMAQVGDRSWALDLLDEAIAQVEQPGWEERWYHAETLRIKGWILVLEGEWEAAERG